MLKRASVWFVISLLCFGACVLVWRYAEERAGRGGGAAPEAPVTNATSPSPPSAFSLASASLATSNVAPPVVFTDEKFPLRLRNTGAALSNLMGSPSAVLLENALLDTAAARALPLLLDEASPGD